MSDVNWNGDTYFSGIHFDSSNEAAALPVKHSDASLALHAEEDTAAETFGLETNVKTAAFLELSEELDACT